MKKLLIGLAVLLAVGLALVVLLRPTVKVAKVVSGTAVQLVPGSVLVAAEYQMEVRSEAGGRVISSELDLGKAFAQGEPMVQIDPTDLKLDIEHTENDFAVAKKKIAIGSSTKAELAAGKENLEYLEGLAKSGNYPLAELEKRRRELKEVERRLALEEVDQAQTLANYELSLKAKRRQLDKMTVRAPFDGVVSVIYMRPGDLIGQGTAVAVLISTSRRVEARISEENFAGIKLGQRANVRFLGYGENLYPATITKILPTAEPSTQRYVVNLDVKVPREKLVPGITGEVTIVVGERPAQAIIPRRALSGNQVYVVQDGRVRLRQVETGYVSLTAVEILKGLQPGELVMVEEMDKYHDGDRVKTELVTDN